MTKSVTALAKTVAEPKTKAVLAKLNWTLTLYFDQGVQAQQIPVVLLDSTTTDVENMVHGIVADGYTASNGNISVYYPAHRLFRIEVAKR